MTIKFSKEKASARREKLKILEDSLKVCEDECGKDPCPENAEKLEILRTEYDVFYEHLSVGAIIRSRATWYEYGEKSNKYFLNLESHKKSKSCIRKIYTKEGCLTSDPKRIMKEVEFFYSKLYRKDDFNASDNERRFFLQSQNIPKLSNDDALSCEGKLTFEECLRSLNSFQNNKSPGNDGLTVEFYRAFWDTPG